MSTEKPTDTSVVTWALDHGWGRVAGMWYDQLDYRIGARRPWPDEDVAIAEMWDQWRIAHRTLAEHLACAAVSGYMEHGRELFTWRGADLGCVKAVEAVNSILEYRKLTKGGVAIGEGMAP